MALVLFLENPLRNFRQTSTHTPPQSLTPPLTRSSSLPSASLDFFALRRRSARASRRRNPRLLPSPPTSPPAPPRPPRCHPVLPPTLPLPSELVPPAPSPAPTRLTAAAAAQISLTRDATPRGNTPSWLACSPARACIGILMHGAQSSSPQHVVRVAGVGLDARRRVCSGHQDATAHLPGPSAPSTPSPCQLAVAIFFATTQLGGPHPWQGALLRCSRPARHLGSVMAVSSDQNTAPFSGEIPLCLLSLRLILQGTGRV
jgi:hypothetical protein